MNTNELDMNIKKAFEVITSTKFLAFILIKQECLYSDIKNICDKNEKIYLDRYIKINKHNCFSRLPLKEQKLGCRLLAFIDELNSKNEGELIFKYVKKLLKKAFTKQFNYIKSKKIIDLEHILDLNNLQDDNYSNVVITIAASIWIAYIFEIKIKGSIVIVNVCNYMCNLVGDYDIDIVKNENHKKDIIKKTIDTFFEYDSQEIIAWDLIRMIELYELKELLGEDILNIYINANLLDEILTEKEDQLLINKIFYQKQNLTNCLEVSGADSLDFPLKKDTVWKAILVKDKKIYNAIAKKEKLEMDDKKYIFESIAELILFNGYNQRVLKDRDTFFNLFEPEDIKKYSNLKEELAIEKNKFNLEKEKIQRRMHKLEEEVKKLKNNVKLLEKEKKHLENEFIKLENNNKEVTGLRNFIFNLTNNIDNSSNENLIDYEKIKDLEGIIIGGDPNIHSKIKKIFPKFKLIGPEQINFDASIIDKYAKIYIYTGYLSHGLYYKVINYVRNKEIEIKYINNTKNIVKLINQILTL